MWFEGIGILLTILHLIPTSGLIETVAFGPLQYLGRAFVHANWAHLGANLFGLYQVRELETRMGFTKVAQMTVFTWIVSSLLLWGVHQLMNNRKIAVGFSGVIFGLALILEYLIWQNWQTSLALMIRRIVPQLLIPGISFWGHLMGILSGVLYILFYFGG